MIIDYSISVEMKSFLLKWKFLRTPATGSNQSHIHDSTKTLLFFILMQNCRKSLIKNPASKFLSHIIFFLEVLIQQCRLSMGSFTWECKILTLYWKVMLKLRLAWNSFFNVLKRHKNVNWWLWLFSGKEVIKSLGKHSSEGNTNKSR